MINQSAAGQDTDKYELGKKAYNSKTKAVQENVIKNQTAYHCVYVCSWKSQTTIALRCEKRLLCTNPCRPAAIIANEQVYNQSTL